MENLLTESFELCNEREKLVAQITKHMSVKTEHELVSLLHAKDREIATALARAESAERERDDVRFKLVRCVSMLRAFRHSMDSNKPFPSLEKLTAIIEDCQ